MSTTNYNFIVSGGFSDEETMQSSRSKKAKAGMGNTTTSLHVLISTQVIKILSVHHSPAVDQADSWTEMVSLSLTVIFHQYGDSLRMID